MAHERNQDSTSQADNLKKAIRQARGYLFSAAFAWSLLLLALGGSVVLGLYTLDQRQASLQRQAHHLAKESSAALEEGNATLATLLALEALPDPEEPYLKRPFVPEAEAALYASVGDLTERQLFEGHVDHGGGENAKFFALRQADEISVVDVVEKATLFTMEVDPEQHLDVALSHDGAVLAALDKKGILALYDVGSGEKRHEARLGGGIKTGAIRFMGLTDFVSVSVRRADEERDWRIFDIERLDWLELEAGFSEYARHIETVEYKDTQWMFLLGLNKSIGVVNVADRSLLLEIPGDFSSRSTFAVSDDARWFAAANSTGDLLTQLRSARRDPETREIAEEDRIPTDIVLVDLETRALAGALQGHYNGVASIDIDSERNRIASVSSGFSAEKAVVLWDLVEKQSIARKIVKRVSAGAFVRFRPDSRDLFVVSTRFSALFDEDLNVKQEWSDLVERSVTAVSNPKSSRDPLIVRGSRGSVTFLDRWRGRTTGSLKLGNSAARVDTYPEADRFVLHSRSDPTALVTGSQGQVIARFGGHETGLSHAHFLSQSGHYVTIDRQQAARTWQHDVRFNRWDLFDNERIVSRPLAFAPDDSRIITIGYDTNSNGRKIVVYDRSEQWRAKSTPIFDEQDVSALKFAGSARAAVGHSPRQNSFVSYDFDEGTSRVIAEYGDMLIGDFWPLGDGQEVLVSAWPEETDGHALLISSAESGGSLVRLPDFEDGRGAQVEFSKDRRLALFTRENEIAIWHAEEKRVVKKLKMDNWRWIRGATFDPSSKLVLLEGSDNIAVWDVAAEQFLETGLSEIQSSFISGVAFDPVSNGVLVSERSKFVDRSGATLYDMESGDVVQRYVGLNRGPGSLEFSPDGRYVIGHSPNRDAVLWDRDTGFILDRWEDVREIQFSPGGSFVSCRCGGRPVLFPLLPRGDALIELARESLPPHRQGLTPEEKKRYHLAH